MLTKTQIIFFGRVIALRILVGLARAIRRQIGNTGLGGCKRHPLENKIAFKFCLFRAALIRESSFLRNKFNIQMHIHFFENFFSIFFHFGFKLKIIVLGWVVSTLSFKYIDVIILC